MNVWAKVQADSLKYLSDDEFLDSLCLLLELRGKAAIASKLRAAYRGLGADSEHREDSGVLRDESSSGEVPDNGGSEPTFSPDWGSGCITGGISTGVEENDPNDVYWSAVRKYD